MNEQMRETVLRGSRAYPIVVYHLPNEQYPLHAPFHWQDDTEILVITGGKVELTLKGEVTLLHCGDIICINPGELHSFRAATPDAGCDIFIFPTEDLLFTREDHDQNRFLRPLTERQLGLPLYVDESEKHFILQAIKLQRERPIAYEMQTKALLLQWIARLTQKDALVPTHPSKQGDVCKKILTYIEQHFADPLTVPEVAAVVGISPTYFSAFFTEHFSQHFGEYLRNIRIEQACALLLSTSASVTEIALATGFSSGSHFIHHFRQEIGMTPLAYRKRNEALLKQQAKKNT